jgi:hypothetical protein
VLDALQAQAVQLDLSSSEGTTLVTERDEHSPECEAPEADPVHVPERIRAAGGQAVPVPRGVYRTCICGGAWGGLCDTSACLIRRELLGPAPVNLIRLGLFHRGESVLRTEAGPELRRKRA